MEKLFDISTHDLVKEDARAYVEDLFKDQNIEIEGTILGDIKSRLFLEEGPEFIQRYDLAINAVVHDYCLIV